jgi:hypothetical protein
MNIDRVKVFIEANLDKTHGPKRIARARTRHRLVAVVGIVAAVAGVVAARAIMKRSDPETMPRVMVENQVRKRRLFDVEAREIAQRGHVYRHILDPAVVRVFDDELFVLDGGDYKLKRFTLGGELLNRVVEGRGEGPGEVSTPVDFHVEGDDVWIMDPNPRALHRFKRDGSYIATVKVQEPALRLAKVGKTFFLLSLLGRDLVLQVDENGEEIRRFGGELLDGVENRLAAYGHLLPSRDGGIIYVPHYAGFLFYFDAEGGLQKSVTTIDGVPFPSSSRRLKDSRMMSGVESEIETRQAFVYGEELYLATWFRSETRAGDQAVLDRYDWVHGTYLGSMAMPRPTTRVAVHDGLLYCGHDTTITVYRLTPL